VIKLPKKSGIRYINLERLKCVVCNEPNPNWEAWFKIMKASDKGTENWQDFKLYFCNKHYQEWKKGDLEISSVDGQKLRFDLPGWTQLHCNACNSNKINYIFKGRFQDAY